MVDLKRHIKYELKIKHISKMLNKGEFRKSFYLIEIEISLKS
jgi:hypothetical protein